MVRNRLAFLAAASLLCGTSTKAREAVLTNFLTTSVRDYNTNFAIAPLTNDLLHYLESIAASTFEPNSITDASPATPIWGLASTNSHRSATAPCVRTEYAPTWWLTPEVELRRAAHFGIMTSIACENGIPPNLLDAVISQESGYKGWALSRAGAMGMMQIMPGTAKTLGVANPWDSAANMRAGARYLRQQLDRFGRVDLALAAYNAGPERRSLAQGYVPAISETRNYVRTITTNWLRLTQLNRPDSIALSRAAAASTAIRASGYREVSLTVYDGMHSANPI